MRIIAGTAKGKRLKAVPGKSTRPITDRAKESLFNILGDWVIGSRVLDLFAGTGSVGLEALSRGAAHVSFVEKNPAATRTIGENLRLTGFARQAHVKRADVFNVLEQPGLPGQPFDLIYIAPPQYKELWSQTLHTIDTNIEPWLQADGIVIAQIHPTEFEALKLQNLTLYDRRKYGSTLLCFYEQAQMEAS